MSDGLTLDFCGPGGLRASRINRRLGGKNLYWPDADGHLREIRTVSDARAAAPPLGTGDRASR